MNRVTLLGAIHRSLATHILGCMRIPRMRGHKTIISARGNFEPPVYALDMQRMFSTFPNSWPGLGLLLLRLSLAATLCADAFTRFHDPTIAQILPAIAEIVLALMLIAGVYTPIAGGAVCLLQLALAVMGDGSIELSLQRAAIGLSLGLLGPGAWSIDARWFGRRRVEIRGLREE